MSMFLQYAREIKDENKRLRCLASICDLLFALLVCALCILAVTTYVMNGRIGRLKGENKMLQVLYNDCKEAQETPTEKEEGVLKSLERLNRSIHHYPFDDNERSLR